MGNNDSQLRFCKKPNSGQSWLTADLHPLSPRTSSQDTISKIKRLQLPLCPQVDSGNGAASWRGWWVGGISGMHLNTEGPGSSKKPNK